MAGFFNRFFSRIFVRLGQRPSDPIEPKDVQSEPINRRIVNVTLKRLESTDHGTIGVLSAGDFSCYSMEPPWRDNLPNNSCIPTGKYHCLWHQSPRYGLVYLVGDVEDRSHILIHSGNVGGDREKGLHTHTLGCILLGSKRGQLMINGKRQEAVLVSRTTCRQFFEHMEEQPFELEVQSWN